MFHMLSKLEMPGTHKRPFSIPHMTEKGREFPDLRAKLQAKYGVGSQQINEMAKMIGTVYNQNSYKAFADLKILFARLCFCENVMQEITKRLNEATGGDLDVFLTPLCDDSFEPRRYLRLGLSDPEYQDYLQNLEWNKYGEIVGERKNALPFFFQWFYNIRDTLVENLTQIMEIEDMYHLPNLQKYAEFLKSLKSEAIRSDRIGEDFYRCINRAFADIRLGTYRNIPRTAQTNAMRDGMFESVILGLKLATA
jgi:hypothetical protein